VAGELVPGSESDRALEKLAERNGLPLRRQEERLCPYIALPRSYEDFLSGLSSSTRYHIRRRTRDLEKKGARVDVYSRPEDIPGGLDTLTRLHTARWRKDNMPGTLGRDSLASFLKDICARPPAGSSCRLYILSHQEAPVASLLMFYFGDSALYYQAGWDPDSPVASQSPGVVLMARSVEDAIQSGARYYEFLRGDETYKAHWTKDYRNTGTVLLARSFMARQYLRVAHIKDLVKARLGICSQIATGGSAEPTSPQANPPRTCRVVSDQDAAL
jgi:CelD/BcsL family acetyltransferase involved in cellulose biosynthesis